MTKLIIAPETDVEKVVKTLQVRYNKDKNYDSTEIIQNLLDKQRTDILIIANGDSVPEIHVSNPDIIGTIVYADVSDLENTVDVEIIDPAQINGDADDWLDEFTTYSADGELDITEFMTKFIEKFNN